MIRRAKLAIAMPLLMLSVDPARAADDLRETAAMGRQTAAFAGIHLRMKLGASRTPAATARLKLGLTHFHADARLASQARQGPVLELGFSRRGRADFYVAGQRLTDIQARLGMAPLAAGFLVAGALAVGAVAISEFDELHRRQCLLPEKELCTE